jgi:hypothetical protein
MKKIIKFNTSELLTNTNLNNIKGGSQAPSPPPPPIGDGPIDIVNGGDETEKRPKKPMLNNCSAMMMNITWN